jgi:hypothetical protein
MTVALHEGTVALQLQICIHIQIQFQFTSRFSSSLSRKKLQTTSHTTTMDDANTFNPSNSTPEEEGNTSNPPNLGYRPSQVSNFHQLNQQFPSQFPRNFNPYGMTPNYQPYGGFHPSIPYEANFSFSPTAMFGRGVAMEGARSSSLVESMAYSQGFMRSGPGSPVSPPAPQSNGEDISNQEWSDASDGGERKT